jgi:hypothetical protein
LPDQNEIFPGPHPRRAIPLPKQPLFFTAREVFSKSTYAQKTLLRVMARKSATIRERNVMELVTTHSLYAALTRRSFHEQFWARINPAVHI